MEFSVKRELGPNWLPLVLFLGLILSFYKGLDNSIVFYERLPKIPPRDGFLIFYQPTCPHCIAEIPVIKELVKKGYNVSAVNVFEAKELAEKYGVKATPTIVILPQNIVLEGERSLEELIRAKESGKVNLFGEAGGACDVGVNTCSE